MTPDQTQALLAAVRQFPYCLWTPGCRVTCPETPSEWCANCRCMALAAAMEQAQRERDKLQVQLTRAESALAVVAVTGISVCLD